MKPLLLMFTAILALSGAQIQAAIGSSTEELVGFDKRRERPAAAATASQQKARKAASDRVPGFQVDLDRSLGTPKWVYSAEGALTGPAGAGKAVSAQTAAKYRQDEHRALKSFLDEHQGLFGHGPEVLQGAVKLRDAQSEASGMRTTAWRQQVDGLPVYEAVLAANVSREGELLSVSSLFVPEPGRAAEKGTPKRGELVRTPVVSAQRAIEIAVPVIGEQAGEVTLSEKRANTEQTHVFHVRPLPGDAVASLTWFPVEKETLRLSWQVELSRRQFGEKFRVIVDAQNGEVLLWRKLTVEAHPVTYRVFTNDSPTPMRPGWQSPNGTRPPLVQQSLVTLSALSTNASPLGWINDGEVVLRGNNVDARLDRDADDRADLPRVTASIDQHGHRTFDYPVDPTLHPTNYSTGAAVQLFYWCNWMHDRLYDIGFTEAKGNFQKDNFGRGGSGNDAIVVDAQDGSGVNNANYTPAGDGAPGRIQMFIFSGPNPPHDGDLDVQVVLHEYTHGMSDRRVGHGIGISQFQTFGLGEGWSDFFAEAMLTRFEHDLDANYPMGGYASYRLNGLQESHYYGIRRYPYSTDTNVSPLMFQDIDPNQASSYPGIPRSPIATGGSSEVHRQGEVWCAMLWDLRAALLRRMNVTAETYDAANDFVMRLVAEAMDFGPPNPTFVQARDAILAADRVLTNPTGANGTNYYTIWQAFAKRGLGLGASAPDVTTTFGVVASRVAPQQPPLTLTPDLLAFSGPAGGPFVPAGGDFTLRNNSNGPITWVATANVPWLSVSPTTGTLAGNAQVFVSVQTNLFATLPAGTSTATLTFSNLTTGATLARTVTVTVTPVADPLAVTPTTVFASQGLPGGPFVPATRLYTLQAAAALSWQASNVPPWLTLSKTSGTLAAGELLEFTATLNTQASALAAGAYAEKFYILNTGTGASTELSVTLRVGAVSAFVEQFATNQFDLQHKVLTFTPEGDWYSACLLPATNFFTDPANGTVLSGMSDDEYRRVTLADGKTVSFFGEPVTSFWIGANGNITPDPGINTNAFYPGFFEFFGRTRIAPLYGDLNPAAGGKISWQQLSNRVVVTWHEVPQFGYNNTNNVQLELFYSGQIRMTWLKVELVTGIGFVGEPPSAAVGLSRGTGMPLDFIPNDLTAEVDCSPTARLVLPAVVKEGDGTVQGTVLLTVAPGTNMTVALTSDNTNEVVVPASVVVPAGENMVPFTVIVRDDDVLDGTQTVGLRATFPDRPPAAATISVADNETARIILVLPPEGREGDGIVSNEAFVWLDKDAGTDLKVQLASSNTARVAVPAFAIVPAGSRMGYFDLNILDDNLLNGSESVTIVASVEGWRFDQDLITIRDNDSYQLAISAVPEVTESAGSLAVGGVVSLAAQPVAPVTVTLESDHPDVLFTPSNIEIPAGTLSNTFALFVINNANTNGFDFVRLTASAPGFMSATGSVKVIDDERPRPPQDPYPSDGAPRVASDVVLSWLVSPVPPVGTVQYDVYLGTNSTPTNFVGSTLNEATNRVEFLLPEPLHSGVTYYWRVRASRPPFSAEGPVWSFTTAPFHHFAVEPIPGPQRLGQPFPVTISARDEFNAPVVNFNGTAHVSNALPSRPYTTIVATEIDTDADRVEFQNVSDRNIDIAGWQVVVYDWASWPLPQASVTFPGPAVCKPGDLFQVRNLIPRFAPGSYPNFVFPTNVLWNNNVFSNQVAVLLRDSLGNVVDFVSAFDADATQIKDPVPVSQYWLGAPIPANLDSRASLQRIGNRDSDSALDWVVALKNVLTNNIGLTAPFTNYSVVSMSATPADSFISGVSTSAVCVFDEARNLLLTAFGSGAAAGSGAAVDVLATNDLSIDVFAPDTVLAHSDLLTRIVVTNSGALPAMGVVVTNRFSDGQFVAALASQGTCAFMGGAVVCELGAVPGDSAVVIHVTTRPVLAGMVTNYASVRRADTDGYAGNNDSSTVTLATLPQVSIVDTNASEPFNTATSIMTFTVRLSQRSTATTSVQFATSDGTATGGVDYVSTNGSVVFPPGSTNQTLSIALLHDTLSESNETFSVNLGAAVNGLITRALGIGTINDNDTVPALTVQDVTAVEGDHGTNTVTFNVNISPASGKQASASYAMFDGTAVAGLDYEPVYGVVVFPPGVTNRTISTVVYGDGVYDPGKQFKLVLTNPNGLSLLRAQAVCSILDDDTNELDYLTFDAVPAAAYVQVPFAVEGRARDAAGRVVTDFSGPVRLLASDYEAERPFGTENTPWHFPFGAGFHDSRLQVIYLASDIGAAGQITAISLNVSNLPAQTLSNFTIRTKPFPYVQFPSLMWESNGWTTNFHADVQIVSTGWVAFAFHTPAYVDGQTNLLVDFSFNNDRFSSDGLCRSTAVPTARAMAFQTDGAFGDPLNWGGGAPPPLLTNRVPNARFTIGRPVPMTPGMATTISNGVWSSVLTMHGPATNLTIRAVDDAGHYGVLTGLEVELDGDRDGMPDWWELSHGFDRFDPADGLADADGDGFTNAEEYGGGTDPYDASSVVRVLAASREGGIMSVAVQTVPGCRYVLETAPGIAGPWEAANGIEFEGTGGELVLKHRENAAPVRFYRVRVTR